MIVPLHTLDTHAASFIIKDRSSPLQTRLSEIPTDRASISAITRAELMYGLKRSSPTHRLNVGVRRFLEIVRTPAWDSDAADWYADVRHHLTASSQPIGELDMMIAAHALAAGAVLVTNNARHFARIAPPLALVNWSDAQSGSR